MNIAIIPARGGSKRIPRKNIREFAGKPMIAYAITAANESGLFSQVLVSTDDDEIARTSIELGAEILFVRPQELANDYVGTVPVIAHAIEECKNYGLNASYFCCIYPAVPFLQIDDLSNALEQLKKDDADYCFPVTEFPSAVHRALKCDDQGIMNPFFPEYELKRSQDLEPVYYDAGQFYWGKVDAWRQNLKIHSHGIGYLIPNWRVVDINTHDDWKRAELMFKVLTN